ncbi:MAG: hypothetical protein Q8R71_12980 [Phenylobacterium sp.]|nr:hypothetical protein [Phenylobacterium sp.]
MKIITLLAAGAAALAMTACTDTNPEQTDTAAAMPDTSAAESPAPDAGATGVAGEGAMRANPAVASPDGTAETDENLPPVDLPPVSN